MGKTSSGRSRAESEVASKPERRRTYDDEETPSRTRSQADSVTPSSSHRKRSSRQDDRDRDRDSEYTPTTSRRSVSSQNPYASSNNASIYTTAPNDSTNSRESAAEFAYREARRERRRESGRSTGQSDRPRALDDDADNSRRRSSAYTEQDREDSKRRDSKRQSTSSSKLGRESTRALDNHDASLPQNQFPGQAPDTFTQPYRPPGHAAEYYGDNGESVSSQPGVRPQPPTVIHTADQYHLYTPTVEAAPPAEPSSMGQAGAASSYFAMDDSVDNNASQTTPSRPSRPSKQSSQPAVVAKTSPAPSGRIPGPSAPLSTIGVVAAGAGAGAAAGYFAGSNIQSTSQVQQHATSSSDYQNSAQYNGYAQNGYGSSSRPPQNDPGRTHYGSAAAAAGLAGAAAAGYYAHNQHENQPFQQSYVQGPAPSFVLGQNQSAFPNMQQQQKVKHKHRGPFTKLADWFRDPSAVAQFEEYTEAIGVCKYCFDPNSSPMQAPRKHHYHKHPPSGPGRYGSSNRVDKVYRNSSSSSSSDEGKRRRLSKTKIAAGAVAGYGAVKVGEALYQQRRDFNDTYSVKYDQPVAPSHAENGTQVYGTDTVDVISRRDSRRTTVSRVSSKEDLPLQRRDSGSSRRTRRSEDEYSATKRSSKRRGSSSSRTGISRGAAMSIGAGAAGLAGLAAERRRSRSRSGSRERVSGVRRKKSYYSKRISPRHSYIDLSTQNTGPLGFGSFFSSPSANKKKGKKAKGLFNFRNDSSSSSDADLAFGQAVLRSKNSRKGKQQREYGGVFGDSAAILGLAATGAALAAESDRRSDKRRSRRDTADEYTVTGSRRMSATATNIRDYETTNNNDDEGIWEDAPDDETSSVDTALAYGGRLSARTSRESLADKGTSKWAWRWNKNKDKKPSARRQSEPQYRPQEQSSYDLGSESMVGPGAVAAERIMMSEPSPVVSTPLPPMQLIDPIPTESPRYVETTPRLPRHEDGPSPHTVVSRSPIPLEQPQVNTVPTTAVMPQVLHRLEADAGLTDSPDEMQVSSAARRVREDSQERTRPLRRGSSPPLINPSTASRQSVTWALTEEQIENERKAAEKAERRRSRREEKVRRRSSELKDFDPDIVAESTPEPPRESLDKRAARQAEIDMELQALYAEHERQMQEQKELDEYRRSQGEVGGIAAAVIGAGVGAATVAMVDDKKKTSESDSDRKPRRKSSLKRSSIDRVDSPPAASSPPRTQSPPHQTQQERIARMAAQRVNAPSPVHENYSDFFMPAELADHVKEHNAASEQRQEHAANILTISPDDFDELSPRLVFEPQLYEPYNPFTKHQPDYHPRGVPMLELIEATPPGSRSASRRREPSPLRTDQQSAKEEKVEESSDRGVDNSSKVNWGRNSTHVFEIQTPEDERKDPIVNIDELDGLRSLGKGPQSVKEGIEQPPMEEIRKVHTVDDEQVVPFDRDQNPQPNDMTTEVPEADLWSIPSKKSKKDKKKKRSLVDDSASPRSSGSSVKTDSQKNSRVSEEIAKPKDSISSGRGAEYFSASPSEEVVHEPEAPRYKEPEAYHEQHDSVFTNKVDPYDGKSLYQSPFVETVGDAGDAGDFLTRDVPTTGQRHVDSLPEFPTENRESMTSLDEYRAPETTQHDAPVFDDIPMEKPRSTRSERRRLERAMSSSETTTPVVKTPEPEYEPVPEQVGPQLASHEASDFSHPSMPGDFGVFDYLVDDEGNTISSEANRELEAAAASALSQRSNGGSPATKKVISVVDEHNSKPPPPDGSFEERVYESTHTNSFGDASSGQRQPISKSEHASDPEDRERRSSKRSKEEKMETSKSDVGARTKGAIAAAAAGAATVAAVSTFGTSYYSTPKSAAEPDFYAQDSGAPAVITAEPDFYATPKEKKKKKSKRESEIFDDYDTKSVTSLPSTRDEDRKSKRRSKRDSEIFDDEDTKSVTSMPATKEEDRRSRQKSKRDSDVFKDDDIARSAADDGDERRAKRKSKRDSEIFDDDDTRSVTSTSTEKRRSKDKEKEKEKKSTGLFASLFSSNKSDVSTSSKKSSKSVKSESRADRDRGDDDEREKRKKRRSKSGDYENDSISVASEPVQYSKERNDSRDIENKKPALQDSRDTSVDGSFMSADEGHRNGQGGHADDKEEPFLVEGLEMPQPMAMDMPMGTDGVSGLPTGRQISVDPIFEAKSAEAMGAAPAPAPTPTPVLEQLPPLPSQDEDEQVTLSSHEDIAPLPNITPTTERTRRWSAVRSGDFGSSPAILPSPTAVPIYFGRRYPATPGSGTRGAVPPGPTSPLSTPRSRMQRPKSTDGKEFKPLYLVERHGATKAVIPESEEDLPSLPSSRTPSAHASMEDLRGQALAQLEGQDYFTPLSSSPELYRERGRPHSASYEEYLDSRSATPVPGERQKARESEAEIRERKDKQLKYEFHSPSELLQDPQTSHGIEQEDLDGPESGSPLPSVVSTDNDQEFLSAESRAATPEQEPFQERSLRSRSHSRERSRRSSTIFAGLGIAGAGSAAALAANEYFARKRNDEISSEQEHNGLRNANDVGLPLPLVPEPAPAAVTDEPNTVEPVEEAEITAAVSQQDEDTSFQPTTGKKAKKDKKKKRKTTESYDTVLPKESDMSIARDFDEPISVLPLLGQSAIDQTALQLESYEDVSDKMERAVQHENSALESPYPTEESTLHLYKEPANSAHDEFSATSDFASQGYKDDEPAELQPSHQAVESHLGEEEWGLPSKKSKMDRKKKKKGKGIHSEELPTLDIAAATDAPLPQEEEQPATAIPAPEETQYPMNRELDARGIAAAIVTEDLPSKSATEIGSCAEELAQPRLAPDTLIDDKSFSVPLSADLRSESLAPTITQMDEPGSKIGSFEQAFERAVRARGLASGVSREDALEIFMSKRDNAPFVPKLVLTPVPEGTPATVAFPPVERAMERELNADFGFNSRGSKKSKKDKKKGKKRDSTVESQAPEEEIRETDTVADKTLSGKASEIRSDEVAHSKETVAGPSVFDIQSTDTNPFGNDFEIKSEGTGAPETSIQSASDTPLPAQELTAKQTTPQEDIEDNSWAPISKKDKKKKKKGKISMLADEPSEPVTSQEEVTQDFSEPVPDVLASPQLETDISEQAEQLQLDSPRATSDPISQEVGSDALASSVELVTPAEPVEPTDDYAWAPATKKDKKKNKKLQTPTLTADSGVAVDTIEETSRAVPDIGTYDVSSGTPSTIEDDLTRTSSKKEKKSKKDKTRQSVIGWATDALAPAAIVAGALSAGTAIVNTFQNDEPKERDFSEAPTDIASPGKSQERLVAASETVDEIAVSKTEPSKIERSTEGGTPVDDDFAAVFGKKSKKDRKKKKSKSSAFDEWEEEATSENQVQDVDDTPKVSERAVEASEQVDRSIEKKDVSERPLESSMQSVKELDIDSTKEAEPISTGAEIENEWAMPTSKKKSKKDKKNVSRSSASSLEGLPAKASESVFDKEQDASAMVIKATASIGPLASDAPVVIDKTKASQNDVPQETSRESAETDTISGLEAESQKPEDEPTGLTRKVSKKDKKKNRQSNANLETSEVEMPKFTSGSRGLDEVVVPFVDKEDEIHEHVADANSLQPLLKSTEPSKSLDMFEEANPAFEDTRDIQASDVPLPAKEPLVAKEVVISSSKEDIEKTAISQIPAQIGPPQTPSPFARDVSLQEAIKLSMGQNAAALAKSAIKKKKVVGSSSGWEPWVPTKVEPAVSPNFEESIATQPLSEIPRETKSGDKPLEMTEVGVAPSDQAVEEPLANDPPVHLDEHDNISARELAVAEADNVETAIQSQSAMGRVQELQTTEVQREINPAKDTLIAEEQTGTVQSEEESWKLPPKSKKDKKDKKKRKSGVSILLDETSTPAEASNSKKGFSLAEAEELFDPADQGSDKPETELLTEVVADVKGDIGAEDVNAIPEESMERSSDTISESVSIKPDVIAQVITEPEADDFWVPSTSSKKSKKDNKKRKSNTLALSEPTTSIETEESKEPILSKDPASGISVSALAEDNSTSDLTSAERALTISVPAEESASTEPVEDDTWAITKKISKKDKKKKRQPGVLTVTTEVEPVDDFIAKPVPEAAPETEVIPDIIAEIPSQIVQDVPSELTTDTGSVDNTAPVSTVDRAVSDSQGPFFADGDDESKGIDDDTEWASTQKPSKKDKKKKKKKSGLSTPFEDTQVVTEPEVSIEQPTIPRSLEESPKIVVQSEEIAEKRSAIGTHEEHAEQAFVEPLVENPVQEAFRQSVQLGEFHDLQPTAAEPREESKLVEPAVASTQEQNEDDEWAITRKPSKKDKKKKRKTGDSTPPEEYQVPLPPDGMQDLNREVPAIEERAVDFAADPPRTDNTVEDVFEDAETEQAAPSTVDPIELVDDDAWVAPMKISKKDKKKKRKSDMTTPVSFSEADLVTPDHAHTDIDTQLAESLPSEISRELSHADEPVIREEEHFPVGDQQHVQPQEEDEWAIPVKLSKKDKKNKKKKGISTPPQESELETFPVVQPVEDSIPEVEKQSPQVDGPLVGISEDADREKVKLIPETDEAVQHEAGDEWAIPVKMSKKDKKKKGKSAELIDTGVATSHQPRLEEHANVDEEAVEAPAVLADAKYELPSDSQQLEPPSVESVGEPPQSDIEQERTLSRKSSKKDKKKRKSGSLTVMEDESTDASIDKSVSHIQPLAVDEPSIAEKLVQAPAVPTEVTNEPYIVPSKQETSTEIETANDPHTADLEDEWSLSRKPSKKDKKKKKKGQALDLAEPEAPAGPEATLPIESEEADKAFQTAQITASSVDEPISQGISKDEIVADDIVSTGSTHSAKELQSEPADQSRLTSASEPAKPFLSEPSATFFESSKDIDRDNLDDKIASLQHQSANELHNDYSHQSWLAGAHENASQFPPKPDDSVMPESRISSGKTLQSWEEPEEQSREVISKGSNASTEIDPDSELLVLPTKKSKKDKKKKQKSLDSGDDDSIRTALTAAVVATAVTAGLATAAVSEASKSTHQPEAEIPETREVDDQSRTATAPANTDYWAPVSADESGHGVPDQQYVKDSQVNDNDTTNDPVIDDQETWAEAEAPEAAKDEGLDSTVDDFLDESYREKDGDTSWMKGGKKAKKAKKGKKGSVSSVSSDIAEPDSSVIEEPTIARSSETPSRLQELTTAAAEEGSSGDTPMYDALASAPGTPLESALREPDGFSWASALKKGKKDKKKRKSVTWSDADTSTPATPVVEKSGDLFPALEVEETAGEEDFVTPAEQEVVTEFAFVSEPEEIMQEPESEDVNKITKLVHTEEARLAIPSVSASLAAIEEPQQTAEPIQPNLPTPATEKVEFSWAPTSSKKKSKRDKKGRGSTAEFDEQGFQLEESGTSIAATQAGIAKGIEESDPQSSQEIPADDDWKSSNTTKKSKKDKKKKRSASVIEFDDEPALKKTEFEDDIALKTGVGSDVEVQMLKHTRNMDTDDMALLEDSKKSEVSPAERAAKLAYADREESAILEEAYDLDGNTVETALAAAKKAHTETEVSALAKDGPETPASPLNDLANHPEAQDDEWAVPDKKSKKDKKKKRQSVMEDNFAIAGAVAAATAAMAFSTGASSTYVKDSEEKTSDMLMTADHEDVGRQPSELVQSTGVADAEPPADDFWAPSVKTSKKDKKKKRQSTVDDETLGEFEGTSGVGVIADVPIESIERQDMGEIIVEHHEGATAQPTSKLTLEDDDMWASGNSKKSKKDKKKKKKSFAEEEQQPELLDKDEIILLPASEGDAVFVPESQPVLQHTDIMDISKDGQDPVVDDQDRAFGGVDNILQVDTGTKSEEDDLWALPGKKSKKDKKKRKQSDSIKTSSEEVTGSPTPTEVEEARLPEEQALAEPSHSHALESRDYNPSSVDQIADGTTMHIDQEMADTAEVKRDLEENTPSPVNEVVSSAELENADQRFMVPEDAVVEHLPAESSQIVERHESPGEIEPTTDDFWAPISKKPKKEKKSKKRQSTIQEDDISDSVQHGASNSNHPSKDVITADAFSEDPVASEAHQLEIEIETTNAPTIEPEQMAEDEWAVPGKKSKKDKKKKRRSNVAEDEEFSNESPTSGASLVLQKTDKDKHLDNASEGQELLARELHGAPEHQDWLAGVRATASSFPTAPQVWSVQAPEPELSARDLHNANVHQDWLADIRATAKQFPSKPALTFVPSHDVSEKQEVTDEVGPSREEFGLAKRKSKKGKKDKKAKPFIDILGETVSQPVKNNDVVPQEAATEIAQESDVASDVSASTRERRKRRRSPPLRLGDDPEDLPRDRAMTPPPENDDVMDTALGIAAAMGFGGDQSENLREAPGQTIVHSQDDRGQSGWSFSNLDNRPQTTDSRDVRDSGIQFESPAIHQSSFPTVRDSGFVASPQVASSQEHITPGEKEENVRRLTRPQSPTSSNEDVRMTRRSVDEVHNPNQEMETSRALQVTPAKRQPTPVDPTSKDRSSVLFQSSPSGTTPSKTPRSEKRNRSDLQNQESSRALHQSPSLHERQHTSQEQLHHDVDSLPVHPQSDLHRVPTIHGSHHRSREEIHQSADSPSTRRLSNELASNLIDRPTVSEINRAAFSPSPRQSEDRVASPTARMSLHPIPEGSSPITPTAATSAGLRGMGASRDDPTSGSKSLGKSKSRTSSLRDLRGSATSPLYELPPIQLPAPETYTANGATRERDMAELYDGYGSFPGSPMSPTRPPSVRKRQSMQQVKDLEAKVDQLANDNRSLVEAKLIAERHLEQFSLESSRGSSGAEEALRSVNKQLQERDREIVKLRAEITSLIATHDTLRNEHEQRYSALHDEHSQTQVQWRDSTRELEGLRSKHVQLSDGMEDIVRQEIDSALAVKNAEISRLQTDLSVARASIRDLQAQIIERGADEFVQVRDEDYFDNACQQLCQYVQQWVLRFSKFSDTRVCRSTSEVRDEKIVDRFDNAILDGSDVDTFLADRVKRRDIFMSVIMTMIWEYVFTRYLFGMDRDQRQKLKQLEKNLSEVGPQKAVHQWRALTLTLLSKRAAFRQQCENDTEAVVLEILQTLSKFLPPPQNLEQQIHDSLRKAMRAAVDLSIEMRTQKAEYIMLPPLQPEYDTNGDLARKVFFNSSLMNERSGETTSNDELEANRAVVRIVLFPLVVKKGDDSGQGDEEIVVCPAQVLVARPEKGKRPKSRLASGGSADARSLRAASTHSLAMSGVDMATPGSNMF